MSLPSRERGLKSLAKITVACGETVAPLAGAWIEMLSEYVLVAALKVAPLAGAWIEIANGGNHILADTASLPSRERGLKYKRYQKETKMMQSLPSRERGLKFYTIALNALLRLVAPLAGAWIEIDSENKYLTNYQTSLPSRERGLKFVCTRFDLPESTSLPSRERGLKCLR